MTTALQIADRFDNDGSPDLWIPATPSTWRLAARHLGFEPWVVSGGAPWWNGATEVLPLHIPAGLAIARARLGEVNPDDAPGVTEPADVRAYLLEHDPELREATDAP